MKKIVIVPKKIILYKQDRIKHFFKCDEGFMLRNIRLNIHIAKWNPKGMKLHLQIWLPFFHLVRDNSKWEIGNRYRLYLYH